MIKHSAIYKGVLRHRRFLPVENDFEYPLFMAYIDLDELSDIIASKRYMSVDSFNFVSFRRQDYFAPEQEDLKLSVISEVKRVCGDDVAITSVRALFHFRYFNYVFNPVVFYYCFDESEHLVAILAEITNTPWGERHHYVLPVKSGLASEGVRHSVRGASKHQFEFSKAFHVSPFNSMNMDYRWVFSEPSDSLHVHMDNFTQSELPLSTENCREKHFDSTLKLERFSIENDFGKILIRSPFETVKVMSGIYWQALKLWLKRSTFYDHPSFKI